MLPTYALAICIPMTAWEFSLPEIVRSRVDYCRIYRRTAESGDDKPDFCRKRCVRRKHDADDTDRKRDYTDKDHPSVADAVGNKTAEEPTAGYSEVKERRKAGCGFGADTAASGKIAACPQSRRAFKRAIGKKRDKETSQTPSIESVALSPYRLYLIG